jgi:hypothetical protein
MNLKKGYSLEIVKANVETLKEFVDETTAMAVAASYGRGVFKQEHPDSSSLPAHLVSGAVRKALEVE